MCFAQSRNSWAPTKCQAQHSLTVMSCSLLWGRCSCCPYFIDEQNEEEKGSVTCQRSHKLASAGTGIWSKASGFGVHIQTHCTYLWSHILVLLPLNPRLITDWWSWSLEQVLTIIMLLFQEVKGRTEVIIVKIHILWIYNLLSFISPLH